jgi:hypothetical protein
VNAKTGKPLSKVAVTMHAWNGTFDIHKPPYPERTAIEAITDAEGVAAFHLTQPAPEHIGFLLGSPTDFYGCWGQVFSPEIVLREGVVADYNESKCGRLRKPLAAKPGEIVIVERKLTRWEHMLREVP